MNAQTAPIAQQIDKQMIDILSKQVAAQREEIARLKRLLAARPTVMQMTAATANAEHYRTQFLEQTNRANVLAAENSALKAKVARKRRALKAEQGYSEFLEVKYAE